MQRNLNTDEIEIVTILKKEAMQEALHNTITQNFNETKEKIDFYSKTFARILVNKIKDEFGTSIFIELKVSEEYYYACLFKDAYNTYNELIHIDRL